MATVEKKELKVPREITDKGCLVSLFYLDTACFSNPGGITRGTEVGMQELKKSLASSGQLQAIYTSPSENGETLSVVCGFRRMEALTQIALEKLVRAYNGAKSLKPGDNGFIALVNPRERLIISNDESEIPETDGDTWKNAYFRALKEAKVLVSIGTVADPVDAALKNLTENQQREDFTLTELTSRIQTLMKQEVPQKRIAKGLGVSEPKVSQMIKVGRLVDYLRDMIVESDEGLKSLGLEETELTVKIEQINSALEEIKRRMSLPKANRCSVSFSHLREFSGRVIVGKNKKPIPLSAIIFAIEVLARMDNGKINAKKETMDYGAFITVIDDAEKRATKFEKASDAAADAQKAISEAEGVSTGKTDKVAEDTHPAVAEATTVGDIADAQAETAEANAVAEDGTVTEPGPTAVDPAADMEADGEADITATEAEADRAADKANKAATMKELAGDSEVVEDRLVGQTATKTVDVPEEAAFTMKDPAKIKSQANQYMEYAASDDDTILMADKVCFLYGASELYSIIGMETEADKAHEAYVKYVEGLNSFIEALQNTARHHVIDKSELQALADLRPVYSP